MSVTDREHLSIGEVLGLLQTEFPDVTISKIRFLESQGLIDPERTPSGYRKFYDADIARLRWILLQQRDHFLPLKVIKDRLEGGAAELPFDPPLAGSGLPPEAEATPVDAPEPLPSVFEAAPATHPVTHDASGPAATDPSAGALAVPAEAAPAVPDADPARGARTPMSEDPAGARDAVVATSADPAGLPEAADRPPSEGGEASGDAAEGGGGSRPGSRAPRFNVFTSAAGARREPPAVDAVGEAADPGSEAPAPSGTTRPSRRPPGRRSAPATAAGSAHPGDTASARSGSPGVAAGAGGAGGAGGADALAERSARRRQGAARRRAEISSVSFTVEELSTAVGLSIAAVQDLERYGLIASRSLSQGRRYGDDAVVVAKLAARFAAFGIEARHLRMFRVAVDRELALYEQVVSPLERNRAEGGDTRAADVFDELDRLGADLRDALFHRPDQ